MPKTRQATATGCTDKLQLASPVVVLVAAGFSPQSGYAKVTEGDGAAPLTLLLKSPFRVNPHDPILLSDSWTDQSGVPQAPALLLPLTASDLDSPFRRKMLLRHGVEYPLPEAEVSSGFKLRLASNGSLSDLGPLAGANSCPLTEHDYIDGVSKDWKLVWISGCVDTEPAILQQEVSSQWEVTIASVRPATDTDITIWYQHYHGIGSARIPLITSTLVQPSVPDNNPRDNSTGPLSVSEPDSLPTPTPTPTPGSRPVTVLVPSPKTNPGTPAPDIPAANDLAPDLSTAGPPAADLQLSELPQTELPQTDLSSPGPAIPAPVLPSGSTALIPDVDLGGLSPDLQARLIDDESEDQPVKQIETERAGAFVVLDEVPEGFDSLSAPQTEFVDLYFNQKKLGSLTITRTIDEFVFDDVDLVVSWLTDLKNPENFRERLSQPFETNEASACWSDNEPPGCGVLETDSMAALYDSSKLRIDLFVAQEFQHIQLLDQQKYLAAPNPKPASILSLFAVATDVDRPTRTLDLAARALAGYGAGHLYSELDYSYTDKQARMKEFRLTHFFPDHQLTAGSFSHASVGRISDISVLGVGFGTSLKRRVDLENAFSSPLIVYLQRQSLVQLVVENRILSGAVYPAGNQSIDTSQLPDGSYQLQVKIIDPVEGERTEERRFTKSTLIPPNDSPLYSFTAGRPLYFQDNQWLPDVADESLLSASFAKRFSDQSAYRLGVTAVDKDYIAESELIFLGFNTTFQLQVGAGSRNLLSSAARLSYFGDKLDINLEAESVESDSHAGTDPILNLMFPASYRHASFSINRRFENYALGYQLVYREELADTNAVDERHSFSYRRPVFRRRNLRGVLDASYLYSEHEQLFSLDFQIFYQQDRVNSSARLSLTRDDEGNADWLAGLGSSWESGWEEGHQWFARANASISENVDNVNLVTGLTHPWVETQALLDFNFQNSGADTRHSVITAVSHIGIDGQGIAAGSVSGAESGVVVDVDGPSLLGRFDIVIDGVKVSAGEVGVAQFIGLAPFQKYQLKLIPHGVLSYGIGEDIFEFVLYPGNVHRIEQQAVVSRLVIATLVNDAGEPLEDAIVNPDTAPVLVEPGGLIQVELESGKSVTVRLSSGSDCEFDVPDMTNADEVVVLDEPIVCAPRTL